MSIFCGIHNRPFKYTSLDQAEFGNVPETEPDDVDVFETYDILTMSPVKPSTLVTKSRKGAGKIVCVIAVIGIILLACVVFILMYPGSQDLPEALSVRTASQITLDKILTGALEPERFNGTWISDDELLMKNQRGMITIYNVTSRASNTILRDAAKAEAAGEIQISSDKNYLLVSYNMQKIYRHSMYFSAIIVDIHTQNHRPITNDRGEPLVLQLIKWAPKGNGYAYVYYNNIYYRPNATTSETFPITHSGNASLYNGVCDWVYEEEIFSDTSAMWFSPQGDKLAYASFNDIHTDIMSIPYYGEPGAMDSQYPKMYNLRYPKPGRINPTVQVFVAELNKKTNKEIQLPRTFPDPVLSAVTWINNNNVCLVVMNRVQNKATILSCSVTNGHCNELTHFENGMGWVDMFTPPLFSSDGQSSLFIHSWDIGNNNGRYRHVTYYNIAKNKTFPLTRGKFTVIDILAWDDHEKAVYYHATEENMPMKQHVYKVHYTDTGSQKPECLSCANDKECTFASAIFSKKQSYFVQTCAGPGIPVISIYNKQNKKILTWEDNSHLRKLLKNVTLPEQQFLRFPVGRNMEAHVLLSLPPHMDKSGRTKYPLLVNVYGGPDSNQVFKRFKISWETYFCLNHDVIIAYIDGRGSGRKGDNMLFANYRRLGSVEVEDQIDVTRQIQIKFPFVDKKRSGIWGWSYGGYAAGMVLASDNSRVFKCGVSVAPVTDWIYYDSMYTERFLGLPTEKDNKAGYIASSLVQKSPKLAGKNYLLVHGTLDDNVHYQQSMMLARSLELHDVLFKQQSYPDEVHSLGGVRQHFYHTLGAFFTDCFT